MTKIRLVGGHECRRHSVPYQASLNAGQHFCGGSLISSQWVVSAAHCYTRRIQVRLGEHSLSSNEGTEQLIDSAKIIKHPNYNPNNLDNDIMLIKLSRPATLNRYVKTVALPSRCPIPNEQCMVSGWGATDGKSTIFPDRLQCLTQPIIDDRTCKMAYRDSMTKNMVCSGFMQGGADSCKGDSGGPLVCGGQLQGVVSWGPNECALRDKPGVYARVCRYNRWIKGVMKSN
ncbi:trypsin-3-like [Clupea harengus]|uniref:trypsin n=1 Tax=Clupea harengus TaxID=7950 RepID=A0A6P8FYW1_CLUHA|nr:trypsin-3-like [Clupea harengus]